MNLAGNARAAKKQRALLRLRLLVALTCAALTGAAAPAFAQSREEVERAKQSFQAGATAYAAGEYLAAIQALDAAYALTPLPAIAFSLAQAERRQYFVGHERPHLDRAISLFRSYVADVQSGGRRADALEALSQLEPLAAPQPGGVAAPVAGAADVVRPTRLMITSDSPGASLAIDGAPAAPSPLIREVAPGPHAVEITAEGFFPEKRTVSAIKGELIPVTVTLRERPGALAISAPRGAELYLDGAFISRGGQRVTVTLPSGPHHLAVGQNGHRVWLRSLTLGRAQAQDLDVTLEPTRQRMAARVLFISGAVALGASAVFGGLAIRAQDGAQDFLEKRAAGNVTGAQLADYRDTVERRDRYRIATAASLTTMTGLLLTGLFLHVLDQPDPEQLHRRPSPSESDRRSLDSPVSQLRLLPSLSFDHAGAAVSARF